MHQPSWGPMYTQCNRNEQNLRNLTCLLSYQAASCWKKKTVKIIAMKFCDSGLRSDVIMQIAREIKKVGAAFLFRKRLINFNEFLRAIIYYVSSNNRRDNRVFVTGEVTEPKVQENRRIYILTWAMREKKRLISIVRFYVSRWWWSSKAPVIKSRGKPSRSVRCCYTARFGRVTVKKINRYTHTYARAHAHTHI